MADALAAQLADPHRGLRKLEPVAVVLVLVPAGPDAHLDTSGGDDVDRRSHLGQVRRRPVRVTRAHLPEPHGVGHRSECRHQRPGLVGDLLGRNRDGVEVVVHPQRFVSRRLDDLGDVDHGLPMIGPVDADQIESPSLRYECSESHAAEGSRKRRPTPLQHPWRSIGTSIHVIRRSSPVNRTERVRPAERRGGVYSGVGNPGAGTPPTSPTE